MFLRDFQLRDAEVGGDGRTVVLACVPFDREALVDDGAGPYREVFRRGAFAHITGAARHTELRYAHRDSPAHLLGFGVDLVEDPSYLLGSFRVSPSDAGDQVLALVRDGQLAGVSIGYVPGQHSGDNRESITESGLLVERLRVKRLPEVSLTPAPAYADASVLTVREQAAPDPAHVAKARARAAWMLDKQRMSLLPSQPVRFPGSGPAPR